MRRKRNQGLCPKCLRLKPMTKHHILPKRFFGSNSPILNLCRSCHDLIEELIPESVKLDFREYMELTVDFLRGVGNYGNYHGREAPRVLLQVS